MNLTVTAGQGPGEFVQGTTDLIDVSAYIDPLYLTAKTLDGEEAGDFTSVSVMGAVMRFKFVSNHVGTVVFTAHDEERLNVATVQVTYAPGYEPLRSRRQGIITVRGGSTLAVRSGP